MNESRFREREPWSMTERQPRGDRPQTQQQGMSIFGWLALGVAVYVAYQALPSLQRYLRIERM